MGLFSIFLVGAAATRCAGAIREGRRLFKLLLKSWVLVWKRRKFLIFQGELTDTLSATTRFCAPVIFMTAVDNEVTRRDAFDAGCVAYLRKPFLAKLLIDAIRSVGTDRVFDATIEALC
jgi:hypothetical protein